MKRIIFEKYKMVNFILFSLVLLVFIVMNSNYNKWFQNADIEYIYKVFDAIYHPLMVSAKWLAGILGIFLIIPSHIFRKWLFCVAPPILFITFFLVRGISVHSGNLLNPTRAQMTENGMILLAVITAIFVVGHLIYDLRTKKILPST